MSILLDLLAVDIEEILFISISRTTTLIIHVPGFQRILAESGVVSNFQKYSHYPEQSYFLYLLPTDLE